MAFQYAGDLPVYATSHLYTGTNNPTQDQDLNGIRFCETPWLLNPSDPTRQQVAAPVSYTHLDVYKRQP